MKTVEKPKRSMKKSKLTCQDLSPGLSCWDAVMFCHKEQEDILDIWKKHMVRRMKSLM
jgi:hypothetical protein